MPRRGKIELSLEDHGQIKFERLVFLFIRSPLRALIPHITMCLETRESANQQWVPSAKEPCPRVCAPSRVYWESTDLASPMAVNQQR